MAGWYYAQAGKKVGPISAEQLKQLADNGQLRPEDLVWKDASPKWVPAKSIKGLFGNTALRGTPGQGPPPLPGETTPAAAAAGTGNAELDKLLEIGKQHWMVISGVGLSVLLIGFCSMCFWLPGLFSTRNDAGKSQDGVKTVIIGKQEWMAENLNVAVEGSWTRPDDPEGRKWGRFYTWEAAKNACPPGFHLPSDAEWTELVNYLGGETIAGGTLKEAGSSGFNAKLCGNRNDSPLAPDLTFEYGGTLANFWSSSEFDRTLPPGIEPADPKAWAWSRFLHKDQSRMGRDGAVKRAGYSVRCVKNK